MWDELMSVMDNWYFVGGVLCALVLLAGVTLVAVLIALAVRKSSDRPRRRRP
jgi:hypothetical protein